MSFSNYLENQILTTYIAGTKYIQLHTGDPGEDGTANVLTSCPRVSVTMGAASNGSSANTTEAILTYSGASAAAVTHTTLWDASTAGNCLYIGTTTNKTLNQNDGYRYAVGAYTASVD